MDSLDSEIRNDNKIPGSPGCDSFTRPEEISALSKFLGNIKRNQEQNLNLDNSLEDIPGKTTGLFPEISGLNKDYVKLSSGEREKIEKLEDTFVPLDASVFGEEINSLPQHLVGLNAGNFELNLEDELVIIDDDRDTKLEDKLVIIEDNRKTKLEDKLVTIKDKREVKLENTKEELEVNKKIKYLEDEKVKLKVDNEIEKLSKTKIDLSNIRKTKTLDDTKVKLGGNLIDPKLNEEKLNLDVNNKGISLGDKKLKIEVDDSSIKKLENTLIDIDIDIDTEITLEEGLVSLEINEQKLNIEGKQENLIVENNIEDIPKYRDDLEVIKSVKALDDSIINLVKNDLFSELDDTKIDLQDVKTKISLEEEIIKLAKKEDEEILSLENDVEELDTSSFKIKQISDDIVKLKIEEESEVKLEKEVIGLGNTKKLTELNNNIVELNIEEDDIKLEKEVIGLGNTKKLTDLNNNIVELNIEKDNIKLEKEVIELNNTIESLDLENTIVELDSINTLSSLDDTVITLNDTDNISELGNILVDLENVNSVNELENDIVTIELGDSITELSNVIELLIGTDSTVSLSDYVEKMGDSISPANQDNHDWFDNTEDSNENLIYSEKDKQKLSTTIGNSDLPIESRDGSYDWIDNTVDNSGKPKTLDLGKIKSKQDKKVVNTSISNDIIPDPISEYDWFDNRGGSSEELLYDKDDKIGLSDTISDDDLPLLNRTNKEKDHDWVDNRVDDNGKPKTLDLDKIKSKEETEAVNTDISEDDLPLLNRDGNEKDHDWFDNREGSSEELLYDEDDRVRLKTPTTVSYEDKNKETKTELDYGNKDGISLDLIPERTRGEDYDWLNNTVDKDGNPIVLNLDKIKSKEETEAVNTDISEDDLPLLNRCGNEKDHDWFDNREGSSEELLYDEDDKIGLSDTISDDDLPLLNRTNKEKDHDWVDNRVDDSGKPKTINLDKIKSKQDKKVVNTDISEDDLPLLNRDGKEKDHDWLNNKIGGFELGDEFLEMKSSIAGQSSENIPTADIPNRPTAGEEEYKYKYLDLGQINIDDSLNYRYVKSQKEIDLYNQILNFDYSFIPPSTIGLSKENHEGTRLDNGLETEYSRFSSEDIMPEWISFIKAITTAYLYPGNDGKLEPELNKLESFKSAIQNLINSNKALRKKGIINLGTEITEDDLPILNQDGKEKDHDWFDNREGSSEELLYDEDDRVRLKTPTTVSYEDGEETKTELDYGNKDGISLDLIPERTRGEDYDWVDNRVDDSGKPKTINLDKIKSKRETKAIDTDITDDNLPLLSKGGKSRDHDWFDNRSGSSGGELPKYMKHGPISKLPEFNLSLDLLSRNFSVSSFLRFGAENTVGRLFDLLFKEDKFEWHTPILKEARRKLLEETLALLLAARDAAEKLLNSQRHRLPGDDENLGVLGNMLSGDLSAKGLVKNLLSEFMSPESDNPTNRPQEKTEKWKGYSIKPGEGFYFDNNGNQVIDKEGILKYKSHYLQGKGIETTLTELAGKSYSNISSVEEFYNLLKTSPYFTTSNKVTTTDTGYKVMTLDSNAHWEITLEPFVNDLNNNYTFLPLIEEINIRNKELHGIQTCYNHWIPIISFELQKERLYSRSLGLFNGEMSFPLSMEFSNEFRITLVDDQYKSWRNYFERCAQASVYSSTPNIYDRSSGFVGQKKTKLVQQHYYIKSGPLFESDEEETVEFDYVEVSPINIDKEYRLVSPYKNITFRCKILVMTPQLSTINRYDLLLTLRDITEERSGEIDSSGTELSLSFSIVGENPEGDIFHKNKFNNVKTEPDKKITTWRDEAESKGALDKYGNTIMNSALSIL